jgi:hypothetical protein
MSLDVTPFSVLPMHSWAMACGRIQDIIPENMLGHLTLHSGCIRALLQLCSLTI